MGCCCSSEKKVSDRRNSLTELRVIRSAETDAIPYTPNPKDLPVRVYRDRDDTRNNNN